MMGVVGFAYPTVEAGLVCHCYRVPYSHTVCIPSIQPVPYMHAKLRMYDIKDPGRQPDIRMLSYSTCRSQSATSLKAYKPISDCQHSARSRFLVLQAACPAMIRTGDRMESRSSFCLSYQS